MDRDPVTAGWRGGALLGEGRYGVVVRATRDGDSGAFALKIVRSTDALVRARFHREVEGLARLDHPNVARLVDHGLTLEAAWLVMTLAPGRSLASLSRPLPPDFLLGVLRQIADALAHAHAAGVVHRDLKPANIVVDDAGHAVLVDFGVARVAGAAPITRDGARPGTAAYAAPEPDAGPPADVWALGVIARELAADATGDAGTALAALALAATAPDPDQRPTAAALAASLARWPPVAPPPSGTVAGSLGVPGEVSDGSPTPRIGRYVVEREVGRGGMGVVYRAHDPLLERTVAIKRLNVSSEAARARFAREARSVARLDHPGVIRVLDFGADERGPFYAMPYVDGLDLSAALAAGPLGRDRALTIAIALGEALGAAHAAGIVHRDVKPANVLLDAGERPLLGDFGVAAVSDATRLTRGDGVVGTPAYMAPEQAAGGDVDARVDVYALGAVLFEMLVGEPPSRTSRPLPADPGLAGALRRALEPNPADRYPSMEAFVVDLRRLRAGLPIVTPTWSQRVGRWLRRPAVRVGIAVAAVLAIVVAVPVWQAVQSASARAEAEHDADERRVAMEAEVARLLALGDLVAADRTFEAFATFPAHEGTAALSAAWRGQAGRLEARAQEQLEPAEAWAQAWATATSGEAQALALRGLGEALLRAGRHEAVGHVIALGADVGPELDGLRQFWARWRRRPDPTAGGADAVAARLLMGRRAPWPVRGRPAAVDDDGDGLPELFIASGDDIERLPGGHWLDGTPTLVDPGGAGDLQAAVVPGVGPVLLASPVSVGGELRLLRLDHGVAREVLRWAGTRVLGLAGADLDHDGVGELYIGTEYPERTGQVLTPGPGGWTRRPLRSLTATNATIEGMATLEPGAVYVSVGAYRAWDVRRVVPDGRGDLVVDRRRKVGLTWGIDAVRGPGGPWLAVGVAPGTLGAFPPGVPQLTPGFYLMNDRFETVSMVPAALSHSHRPLPIDADGDGADELVGQGHHEMLVADVADDGAMAGALIGLVHPLVVGDADGDGDQEVVAALGAAREGSEASEAWVLGVGDTPVPAIDALTTTPPPDGIDPAYVAWWRRAEDLVAMGLSTAAEARLEALAGVGVDGTTGALALSRAAALAAERKDRPAAIERWARLAGRSACPPATLLAAADALAAHHDYAPAAQLLDAWRARVGPAGDDGGRAARWRAATSSPTLAADDLPWRIARPLALSRTPTGLRLRSAAPGEVARLPVDVVGDVLGFELSVETSRIEIGGEISVALEVDGEAVLRAELSAEGGGGRWYSHAVTRLGGATKARLSRAHAPEDPQAASWRVTWSALDGQAVLRVVRGEDADDEAAPLAWPAGDVWLVLTTGPHEGAGLDAELRGLRLHGLAVRDVGPMSPIEQARLASVRGDALAVLAVPLGPGEGDVLRAAAFEDLGRWDEADAALIAGARRAPDEALSSWLGPFVFDGPTRLSAAARDGLGARWPRLYANTFHALGWYHASGPRYVATFTRALGAVPDPSTPADAPVWSDLVRHRALAWRAAGRTDLALDAARRAVEIARRAPEDPAPRNAATPVAAALIVLAKLDPDPGRAIAALREALTTAASPEILADVICEDADLRHLHGAAGWADIDAARRSAWPAFVDPAGAP